MECRLFTVSLSNVSKQGLPYTTLHQQLLYTHATPLSAASIVTFLSQLLLYTVTPQLYPHFISNSSTRMQLPCQLPVLLPLQLLSLSATPLHSYSSAVPTLHQQLLNTHATPFQLPVLLLLQLLFSLSNSSALLLLSCTHTSSATPLHACNSLVRCQCYSLYSYFSQLLYTVAPQLYPYFISNSSTRMQLPCQLLVLPPPQLLSSLSYSSALLLLSCLFNSNSTLIHTPLLWNLPPSFHLICSSAVIFKRSMGGKEPEQVQGCHIGPPGYLGWRN